MMMPCIFFSPPKIVFNDVKITCVNFHYEKKKPPLPKQCAEEGK
jgi:hypothetical protein